MNEMKRTIVFCFVASVLAVAAMVVDPGRMTPEIFNDQGETFYPEFTDPQAPKVIEIVDYDEETATARPLKVEFSDGKWRIPSHYNYPADAADRLAQTAAALIELRKDVIVSDRAQEHATFGVIDPLDQNVTSLSGRGQRVTLKDENDQTLADFIIGNFMENKSSMRYMRLPGQNRVYKVESSLGVSAKFEDWIETDLLKLYAGDIRKITVNSYSINERRGSIDNQEKLILRKTAGKWKLAGAGSPNAEKMNALTSALDSLKIADVQPKPANLSADLKTRKGVQLSMESVTSLRRKGFFVTRTGQLLSNEGEILVETASGLEYTLRFGEIAPASGGQSGAGQDAGENERRYVFITVSYSEARAKRYGDGKEPDGKGKKLAEELRFRFADWYYVISGADFKNLRPSRRDLLKG